MVQNEFEIQTRKCKQDCSIKFFVPVTCGFNFYSCKYMQNEDQNTQHRISHTMALVLMLLC